MPLVNCPDCQRRIPSSATACPHCGKLAPLCTDCRGTGTCSHCDKGQTPSYLPCPYCIGSGQCPYCRANKVRWPDSA